MTPHEQPPPGAPAATQAPAAGATRRIALLAGAGAVAAAAGAGLAWWRYEPREAADDLTGFWQQSFPTPEGGTLALAGLRGKPLLVNFWATWCPPCVEELPLLSRAYAERRAADWQFLGLAVDSAAAVQRFLQRAPVSFPNALAGPAGVELTRQLGNAAGGLPFTVVFKADGSLAGRKIGQVQASDLAGWGI